MIKAAENDIVKANYADKKETHKRTTVLFFLQQTSQME